MVIISKNVMENFYKDTIPKNGMEYLVKNVKVKKGKIVMGIFYKDTIPKNGKVKMVKKYREQLDKITKKMVKTTLKKI